MTTDTHPSLVEVADDLRDIVDCVLERGRRPDSCLDVVSTSISDLEIALKDELIRTQLIDRESIRVLLILADQCTLITGTREIYKKRIFDLAQLAAVYDYEFPG